MYGVNSLDSLKKASCYHAQRGVMLIETLLAMVVFIVGVLGIVVLQAKMVTNVSEAKYRSDAAYLANQIVGRMWVDQANLSNYDTDSQDSYLNRNNWLTAVANALPGVVSPHTPTINIEQPSNIVTVTISWQPAGQERHQYTLSTQVQGRI